MSRKAGFSSHRIILMVSIILSFFIYSSVATAEQNKQQAIVDKARLAVEAVAAQPDMEEFRHLLAVSKGVMIIPQFLKAGFFVGGAGGNGVLLTRNENGEWSSPAFYIIGEASFGLQIGVETKELVLVVMTDKGLDAILNNKVQLGAGVSAAVGPVGTDRGALTTTNMKADVFSFANNAGLFIGASVDGSYLESKEEWNRLYYGQSLTAKEILIDRLVEKAEASGLKKALMNIESP